ncbi:MAG: hypothetical protein D6797_04320 [Bdellovibrio sp.]|nr:MAG: hypothetical protein D6797_04320 [Bdellovibrio sp.]
MLRLDLRNLINVDGRLTYRFVKEGQEWDISIDFHRDFAVNQSALGKKQLFSKALGLSKKSDLRILDATAGLLGDSFLMSCWGAQVIALEREKVLYLLGQDALERGLQNPKISSFVKNIRLFHKDSRLFLRNFQGPSFDVIYLDPMFPPKKKRSLPPKSAQFLQAHLDGDEEEARELFAMAIQKALRVVVKRPLGIPPLIERPHHQFRGKSIRYDMYLP